MKSMKLTLAFLMVCACVAQAATKPLSAYNTVVVETFETDVKGAGALPDATRAAIMQSLKEETIFSAVIGPENHAESSGALVLRGRLVDFAPGNAAKRLMIGLGSGRAHARFEFTLTDPTSGSIVWKGSIKHTASFWFNSTTSSSAERAELPEGLAKKFVAELRKQK